MSGHAVKNIRSLKQQEIKPVYNWVVENVFPIIGLNKEDAIPIGSFGKKSINELSGDIDIAISADKFINKGMKFDEIAKYIEIILKEYDFDTNYIKGFNQVSISVPINDSELAQVDLMISPDLNWSDFIYHSPNLKENESKYKGAVRNALLLAILSESTKVVNKLYEGKTEEYTSLAVRFPSGVWEIKKSLMGKKGLIKQGKIVNEEFLTRSPKDVIELALGDGYGIGAANSFETLWEIIHRKSFIYKDKLNEIMSKFKVNLQSMMQPIPEEAINKYKHIFTPKNDEELLQNSIKLAKYVFPSYEISPPRQNTIGNIIYTLLKNGYKEKSRPGLYQILFSNGDKEIIINRFSKLDFVTKYYINEELLAHIGDPFDPVGLYKNPQRIDNFAPWIKAFLDMEGNLYTEDIPEDWLHKDMAIKLKELGKLYFAGEFYDNNFVTMIRIGSSNAFGLTEGVTPDINTLEIINRANKKFPQYKFFNKHYEDIREI